MYSIMWGNDEMVIQHLNVSDAVSFVNFIHIDGPGAHKNVQWNLTIS